MIVITGGAGFIGSNLTRRLFDEGHEVKVIDDFSRGSPINLKDVKAKICKADLRDYPKTLKALKGVDTVYHLAARVGGVDALHSSNSAELTAFQDNVRIDANVFQACTELGIKKVVYPSSVAVYPLGNEGVFKEEDATFQGTDGGYGWAKLFGEYQLKLMENTKSAVGRLFAVYGPNFHIDRSSQVVAALMLKALRYPKEEFVVWGSGRQVRDFMYVSDCVEALLLLEKKAEFPPPMVNVGTGTSTTIRELAEKIVTISGKKMPITYDASKMEGPLSRVANNEKLKGLGWRPKVSLDRGSRLTYEWLQKYLEGG